jgi:hypothetical protein
MRLMGHCGLPAINNLENCMYIFAKKKNIVEEKPQMNCVMKLTQRSPHVSDT